MLSGAILLASALGTSTEAAPRAVLIQPQIEPQDGIAGDVTERSTTLQQWNGYDINVVKAESPRTLKDELNAWANHIKQCNERALIYYRGEVRSVGNAIGLTVNGKSETLPLQALLHEVSKCATKQPVVVVIDSRSSLVSSELQRQLTAALAELPKEAAQVGLVVMQQDGVQQRGAIWQERSLPGYWLDRGLRGEADQNADRAVTWSELDAFLKLKVRGEGVSLVTAARPEVAGSVVSFVRLPSLDVAIEDLAERVALKLHQQKTQVVALPDLEVPEGAAESKGLPGREFGPLMRYSLEKFKSELAARSWMQYRVLQDALLREQLNLKGVQPNEAQSPGMLEVGKALKERTRKQRIVMLLGSLRREAVDRASLQLDGWNDRGEETLSLQQAMPLGVAELSMIGRSAVMKPALQQFLPPPAMPTSGTPKSSTAVTPAKTTTPKVIDPLPGQRAMPIAISANGDPAEQVRRQQAEQFEKATRERHPLLQNDFPFDVELRVQNLKTGRYEPVPLRYSDDKRDAYVELIAGQVYAIRIRSKTDRSAFLRLLVDGLNTLPDQPLTVPASDSKDFVVTTKDLQKELEVAPIASLNNARAWFCDPKAEYEVRGFFTPKAAQSGDDSVVIRQFEVTDASTSEAAAKKYHKDIGIVTAAFYVPQPAPMRLSARKGDLGTKLGKERDEKVTPYEGKMYPGELLGVVHLRYGVVPPTTLAAKR